MTAGARARTQFNRLPVGLRRQVLHHLGRYAPWEPEFDFTPPSLQPGEQTGPPDFVGIGIQKAGTTWWYQLVLTHPGVFHRPELHKERHFFDRYGALPFGPAEVERYHGWFPRPAGSVTGEWTPDYATFAWAPPLLHQAAPEARLLLLLRDPVERFRSGRDHQTRMGVPADPASAADAVERGFYRRALDRWLEYFSPDQLLVLQYERCTTQPVEELQATFRFLGLPAFTPPGLAARTQSPAPAADRLDPDVKKRLVALYESDVVALAERLPQIDLTRWPNFAYLAGGGTGPEASNSPT